MNIFNNKRRTVKPHTLNKNIPAVDQTTVKSPIPIGLQILMFVEDQIQQAEKEISSLLPIPSPDDFYDKVYPADIQTLINMGFVNSEKVIQYKQKQAELYKQYDKKKKSVESYNKIIQAQLENRNDLIEKFKFLLRARQKYGPNTILIPNEKFAELVDRNGLVCGSFSHYTGNIPEDKVEELQSLLSISEHLPEVSEISIASYLSVNSFDTISDSAVSDLHKFPLIIKKDKPSYTSYTTYHIFKYGYLRLRQTEIYVMPQTTHFFIAAPEKNMNSPIPSKIERHSITTDPLICALTKYGVLLTVRWGEEANDELIKKCEELNTRIDMLLS